ncbi:hypothetical protein M2391_003347, partial [Myroides odoratus]|nr:hypothetical protein [Myroides odoratus]MCS4240330.1 hypothetical protein [Myroides odoratus]
MLHYLQVHNDKFTSSIFLVLFVGTF